MDSVILHDILAAAIEGGIRPWAAVVVYRTRGPGAQVAIISAAGARHRVDADTVQRGLDRLLDGEVYASDAFRDRVRAEVASGDPDIDAAEASAIVQLGLFGAVLCYG